MNLTNSSVRIKCIAPVFDRSGYAEWSRNYILSLIEAGVPVTIQPVSFDVKLSESESWYSTISKHVNRPLDYNVAIAWLTPNVANGLLRNEKSSVKKILFTLWETDKLPSKWEELINSCADECWCSGEWTKKVFIDSGVTVPVKSFKYPINFDNYNIDEKTINKPFSDSTFLFYSISQWSERKNFSDLLEAYWSEFSESDDVALLLKTHLNNNSPAEYAEIIHKVKTLKSSSIYNKTTAPVVLMTELFSSDQILALHKVSDCYVSTARGEGLGLGMLEAGLFGNEVITHNFGEQSSYINNGSGYIYDYTLRPVSKMNNPFYTADQYWAQPDLKGLSKCMREAYDTFKVNPLRRKNTDKGTRLKEDLSKVCTFQSVSKSITDHISSCVES